MTHDEILKTYIPTLERENDSFFIDEDEISKETYMSLSRIQSETYCDEQFEEDPHGMVISFYDFLIEGITEPEGVFDDKMFMMKTMLEDIWALRKTIVFKERKKWN